MKVGEQMTSITIRIEETEKEALQKFAKENDLSLSQAVRRAIKYLLDLDRVADEFNKIPN